MRREPIAMTLSWKNIRAYFWLILLSVGVGALSGFLTKDSMQAYEQVPKSSLTPPSVVFPIVWTILFILMGIGAAMVLRSKSYEKGRALLVYGIQLIVNFFWSIIFFNLRAYLFAFVWLILLWVLIVVMIRLFYKAHKPAGLLQLPYLLWVSFAGYLNFVIWMKNK